MRPTFSVILPTYNRADMLGRAVRSVLNQTYEDFELIIVDDASSDATGEVVKSIEDGRIIYTRLEKNGGPAVARNAGIRLARGQYISFIDDDDEYLPGLLEEIHQVFVQTPESVAFVWCGTRIIEDARGRVTVKERLPSVPKFRDRRQAYLYFLQSLPLGTGWGAAVRPSCFEKVGLFDEELRTDVDRDFFIRLAQEFDFEIIPKVLVKVYRHSGPKVSVYGPLKAQAYERILEKNITALREYPSLWAAWHYKTGWLHYHSGNRVQGREFMLRALRKQPSHLKIWLALLLFEVSGSRGPRLHQLASRLRATLMTGTHLR